MANIKITLDTKQLYPAVVNLKQFSNNTDVLTFEMENYMYETTDLSKLDAYAVCDMVNQEVDEVKLEKQVVENKLRLTWTVTGYTTQLDGHINYQIVFKNVKNDKSVIWFSHQGIIFISESHDADGYIAAKYPTILQQWEERMKTTDANASNAVDQAQASADTATQKANEASQSAAKAESEATDAETNAAKVEEMRDYINQLINYEGTNAIEKEVVQARGDYDTLGNRLDDMIKGYVVETGNSYDGLASDGGIVVNKIKGAYTESIPEPAPDYQVEPKFFNAKHITSHGRQLFDANKFATNTVNGITLTSLKDGSLRLSGTATSDASFPVDLTHKETVELFKVGSLYLKGAGMIENAYFTVYLMKSRGETTSELRSDQTISIDQSFLDEQSSFVRFYIWIKTGVTVNHIIKPMLYQDGSGEFEPFKYDDVETDIVLRVLPNGVHDEYIYGNILRRIGVMILDGSSDELWAKPTTPAMGSGYSKFLSDALKKLYKAPSGTSISNQNIISDRLKVMAGDSEDYKSSNCIVMQYTDDVLRIVLEDSITGGTLEGMKTWLSSNPITVYYELATPVIEEYKLPTIGSYYPFTHVQHDSEIKASEIEWHITATSSQTKNIDDIYAILENKMDKVAVFSDDGEQIVKKIDLGFKMKEEEGNVTKGQLLDRDTKDVLYPETTKDSVIGLQDELNSIIHLDGSTVSTEKDWNDLDINKIYLVSGTYQTSLNAPIDTNLTGMLIYMSVPNGASQIVIPRIASGKVYIRGKSSNAWNEWICVQDYNNLINKPTSMKNPNALTFTGGVTGTYDGSSAKTVNIPTKLPADGGNASTVGEVGISDIVQKSDSGMLKFPTKNNNGLNIALTNGVGNGKIELINNYSDASDATNLPIQQMIAIKVQYIASSTMGMVRLYELWPVRGRVWQNEYNGTSSSTKWDGWKLVYGEYLIWTGSATEGQSVGQTGNYVDLDMFTKLKVVANGTAMILSIGSDNVAWGSAITVGGSKERYLCSVKLTLNKSLNQFSVNVCSQIAYPNNSPTKMTLTRIIGLP